MKRAFLLLAVFIQLTCFAQEVKTVSPPEINEFSPMLTFLSSAWFEGREVGEKGSFMAADYIASQMQEFGLQPADKQSFFQEFTLLKYTIDKPSITFTSTSSPKPAKYQLKLNTDYSFENAENYTATNIPVLFAGYGINDSAAEYNDYAGNDAAGKVVVVLDGFPGINFPNSKAYQKFSANAEWKYGIDQKIEAALHHRALALLIIDQPKTTFSEFEYARYSQQNKIPKKGINCLHISYETAKKILSKENIDIALFEKQTSFTGEPFSSNIKNLKANFNISLKTQQLQGRNVLGVIEGKDKSKTVIIGAHYDHLGKRGNNIYYGSDDNASGVAGLLAFAKKWTESGIQPPCNLLFASWTAEEKGLLGSGYFVKNYNKAWGDILLYINMDMISRSEANDTLHQNLSIGTRTADENLRQIARESNQLCKMPFNLDLWDVTGHWGSDYGSFLPKNIPVMTFNTGLHNDYHTPRDTAQAADLQKMKQLLQVVNECLNRFLNSL